MPLAPAFPEARGRMRCRKRYPSEAHPSVSEAPFPRAGPGRGRTRAGVWSFCSALGPGPAQRQAGCGPSAHCSGPRAFPGPRPPGHPSLSPGMMAGRHLLPSPFTVGQGRHSLHRGPHQPRVWPGPVRNGCRGMPGDLGRRRGLGSGCAGQRVLLGPEREGGLLAARGFPGPQLPIGPRLLCSGPLVRTRPGTA